MGNLVTKLSSIAALIGVVAAIGGGFVQYGKIQAKLTELDKRKPVINPILILKLCPTSCAFIPCRINNQTKI